MAHDVRILGKYNKDPVYWTPVQIRMTLVSGFRSSRGSSGDSSTDGSGDSSSGGGSGSDCVVVVVHVVVVGVVVEG